MKFNIATVCLVISLCITLVSAQIFGGYNSLSGDFGGPSAFSGFPAVSGRDPRQNTGPVVFPPAPADAVEETSGVVIGGSGFGFVPPRSQIKLNSWIWISDYMELLVGPYFLYYTDAVLCSACTHYEYRMHLNELQMFKTHAVALKETIPNLNISKKYILVPGPITPRPGYKFILIHPSELKKYL